MVWDYLTLQEDYIGNTIYAHNNKHRLMLNAHSTSQMAQDVIDILDYLGWKDNIHLDGVSMGGMISLELATTWPERFASLVLTSTTPGRQIPPVNVVLTEINRLH